MFDLAPRNKCLFLIERLGHGIRLLFERLGILLPASPGGQTVLHPNLTQVSTNEATREICDTRDT
jgi:hypothetical protein